MVSNGCAFKQPRIWKNTHAMLLPSKNHLWMSAYSPNVFGLKPLWRKLRNTIFSRFEFLFLTLMNELKMAMPAQPMQANIMGIFVI